MAKGKRIAWIIFAVIILLIGSAGVWIYASTHTTYWAAASPVTVCEIGDHPANRCQNKSSVWMGAYDGKLYFYPRDTGKSTGLDGYLCTFAEGGAKRVLYLCEKGYRGSLPRQFMFLEDRLYFTYKGISLYDFQTGEIQWSMNEKVTLPMYTADGSVYFPDEKWQERTHLCQQMAAKITDGVMTGMVPLPVECGFRLSEDTYFVLPNNGWNSDGGFHAVYKLRADGGLDLIEECNQCNWLTSIIPVENGLLVHHDETGRVLQYIDSTGQVTTLFATDGVSVKSAVTVVGSDAYLSVNRFEKEAGFYQLQPFENDTVPGTYRISLKDFSTEKLSDAIYDGLFNFDDTCLYACYKRNMYRLNLDGTVQETLLKIK